MCEIETCSTGKRVQQAYLRSSFLFFSKDNFASSIYISAFYDFRLIATGAIVEVSMIIYIAYKERLLTEINATDRSRMKKKVNGYFMIYMSITSLHYRARRRRIISRNIEYLSVPFGRRRFTKNKVLTDPFAHWQL